MMRGSAIPGRVGARIGVAIAALGALSAEWAFAQTSDAPQAQELASGVWIVAGAVPANREPDGNSVIFEAPAGLVVFDTGRHPSIRAAIIALARSRDQAVIAIINSHWHLDHVSGNPALRAAFPGLRVYASDAIDNALSGFLASSARDSQQHLQDPELPAELRDDIRADLETIRNGAALKPDAVIRASGPLSLAGRVFQIHLAADAATAGDVWLYDELTGVAALGDLVTFPAPFLDTACPDGWRAALAQVADVPFKIAVPGHGGPLTRAQFSLYRHAFEAFIACAASTAAKADCASAWSDAILQLAPPQPPELPRTKAIAAYYVEMLRANGGRSRYCEAAPRPRSGA